MSPPRNTPRRLCCDVNTCKGLQVAATVITVTMLIASSLRSITVVLVDATVRMVDPNVFYRAVRASRGKAVHAEPIAALYEQKRVHHVGTFPMLEDQMSAFTFDFDRARAGYSPDHVDALVWALSELMVEPVAGWGLLEWTRLEAEKANAPRVNPTDTSLCTVTLLAPPGISDVHLMSGRAVSVPADRLVAMTMEDSKPLLGIGWKRIEPDMVVSS